MLTGSLKVVYRDVFLYTGAKLSRFPLAFGSSPSQLLHQVGIFLPSGPGCSKPVKQTQISENFDFSFRILRRGFLFVLFVLQF